MINVVLWAAGIVLVVLAALRARPLVERVGELDRLADNARRYESWRGGSRTTAAGDQKTGADVMREMLRRQLYTWVGVGIVGIILIIAGFAIR
jgi:hypothetical protein